ncbi:GGDEF domain-containing protein [Ochrobactrum sp. Q0168]|uniref:GGDEF domain-containing protein n=1 Tax=Ochrobactrum sp. Q0168 TaxID=2793241 RepID=UPI0018EB60AC|nr:GGDEF domain-containing protein [Ochrobactrum sp. Q0168]
MGGAALLNDATRWGSQTGLGATEEEWVELVSHLPEEQSMLLSDLVERHKQDFVEIFYSRLMQNREAAAFLSQTIVHDRLQHSLRDWLVHLLVSRPTDVAAFVQEQRKIGEVHARIQVPIHVVMQGARLLKNEIIRQLKNSVLERNALARLIVHVSNAVDIAIEIMSQAFVKDARKSAQTDEAYRAFTLSHDIPLERESQRAALMEWSQSLLFNLYGNSDSPLLSLGSSDFGLWLQHKADMLFSGSTTLERLRQTVNQIDYELLPALTSARKSDAAGLAAIMTEFQTRIGEAKFLLAELFQAAATMETGRDPLTRALNRRFLPPILTREIRMASQKGLDLSILMVDIDHFKRINDTHGHSGGDAILQQVAETILAHCRPGDFVFRYGGEEFLVALVETDEHRAFAIGEELRELVQQQKFNLTNGTLDTVTLSIGIATFNGHPDYTHLVDAADQALYRAKQAGRNRCETEVPLAVQ